MKPLLVDAMVIYYYEGYEYICYPLRQDLTLALLTFWDQRSHCCGDYPEDYRMFSSIPDVYLLDASSSPPIMTIKSEYILCQTSPKGRGERGGVKSLPDENHCSEEI